MKKLKQFYVHLSFVHMHVAEKDIIFINFRGVQELKIKCGVRGI